jgi:UDP-glucuronate decarboxylase
LNCLNGVFGQWTDSVPVLYISGPVNLGNPSERTVLDLAQKIIELTGSQSKIVFLPLPGDDPIKRKPDISVAQKELGWEPEVDIIDGLKKTINYFKTV